VFPGPATTEGCSERRIRERRASNGSSDKYPGLERRKASSGFTSVGKGSPLKESFANFLANLKLLA
jgi:hypothetical protein